MDEVAERAGYTKGAVYSSFASKEDLFFAVYERRVERRLGLPRSAGGKLKLVIADAAARPAHADAR